MDEKQNKKLWYVIVILLIVIVLSGIISLLVMWFSGYFKNDDYSEFITPTEITKENELPENPVDFAKLQKTNPDVYAWIKVPNTRIDYPILQSYVDSDNFYLDHNMYREKDINGSIYTQKMNSKEFTDPVTVMYGHNMASGKMFRDIHKFKDEDFFNKNKYMYVYIKGHILKYEIFSIYVYDNRHIMNSFDFSKKDIFQTYIDHALNPTSFTKNVRKGVSVTTNDRILTLSTCLGVKTQRLLLQGVLTDDQQTK